MKKNLWESYEIKNSPKQTAKIKLHIEHDISPALRDKFIVLAKRLRQKYVFPLPISVYVVNAENVTLRSGRNVYGSFRWFPKRNPIIKVAAAYEKSELEKYGKDELDIMILSSLIHELTHYYQYCSELDQTNAIAERQANYYRYLILEQLMPEL